MKDYKNAENMPLLRLLVQGVLLEGLVTGFHLLWE
jgi:hypothetical protein